MRRLYFGLLLVLALVLVVPAAYYGNRFAFANGPEAGAELIELRGRNYKTYDLGNGDYQAVFTGPLHYQDTEGNWQEIDNAWVPAPTPWDWKMETDSYHTYALGDFTSGQVLKFEAFGSSVAFQPMELQWANDLNQIQAISMPQNVPVFVTNTPQQPLPGMDVSTGSIKWLNGYGTGRHFEWLTVPGSLIKQLQLDSPPPIPESYIVSGGNPMLRLNFIFAPSSDLEIWVDGIPWDKNTKRQTFGAIEFRRGGQVLWVAEPARYWDSSNNVEQRGITELRRSGSRLYISVLVPYGWVQAATYPIFIDPTFTTQAASKDTYINGASPTTNYGGGEGLIISYDSFGSMLKRALVEFSVDWGVDIPSEAIISSAVFSATVYFCTGSDTYYVSRLLRRDWVEMQATWNIYKTGSSWTTAGCGSNGNDYTTTDQVGITISSTGWKDWTITNQVQTAQSGDFDVAMRVAGATTSGGTDKILWVRSSEYFADPSLRPKLVITYTCSPTATTSACSDTTSVSTKGNGEITDTGGATVTRRGFCYKEGTTGDPTTADSVEYEDGTFGTGAYSLTISGLDPNTSYRVRAYALNSIGTGYGNTVTALTCPGAPTNVAATDGTYTDKAVITWTKSEGATGYKVYRDGDLVDTLGDVATYNDMGADAPTITPGTASATDGTYTDKVTLSLSGEAANNGTTHAYTVKAFNTGGDSVASDPDDGWRGIGALTRQWYYSENGVDYSILSGATSDPWDDTTAPAGTITPGTADAGDGLSTAHVSLTISGESTDVGDTWYYKCSVSATGATPQYSTSDTGYRDIGALEYQWQWLVGAEWQDIAGATTESYDHTGAPAGTIIPGTATATDGDSPLHVALALSGASTENGDTVTYRCSLNAEGAESQVSASDTGYRAVGELSHQWEVSAGDSDENYSNIGGATTASYNYTGAPAPTITPGACSASDGTSTEHVTLTLSGHSGVDGDGRRFRCTSSAAGADNQTSTPDRGYRGTDGLAIQALRSAADSDADYSEIPGATSTPYNDTDGVVMPDGRYYKWAINMTGAVSQNSAADRGYKLVVLIPTVTAQNATTITGVSAIVHGTITDTGNENPNIIGFEWGLSSGNYSHNWTDSGSFTRAFQHTISGLSTNTQVLWRAFAINSAGRGNSTEMDFWTLALPLAPTDFTITQIGYNSYNISWTMGAAANTTTIRVSETGYPPTVAGGYPLYSGNETWVIVNGLNPDMTTYYYRAWSENEYGYSLDYAETSLGNPFGIPQIIFVLGLCGFALWKKDWIRVTLTLCILTWGVFAVPYDIKIAAPLITMGVVLFIMTILALIRGGER